VADPVGLAVGSTAPGHYGVAATGVTIAELSITAAWNFQGDPARPPLADALRSVLGIELPLAPNTVISAACLSALWIGPTSWLLVAQGASPLVDFAAKRDALNAEGGALFDLTASRVAWTVSGPHAASVLASGCPLDLHPRTFPAGSCAQSVLWHLDALIAKRDEVPTFTVMVARSLARDAWHGLCESAAQYGYDVAPAAAARSSAAVLQF
jgi:sarcosine oxidase subunit gamma